MISLTNYLVLSAILFSLGFYGVLVRRSAILILISVELMLAAVSINFVAFASYLDAERFSGIIFTIFVITIAAAEVRPPVVEYYFEAVDPNHLALAARERGVTHDLGAGAAVAHRHHAVHPPSTARLWPVM